MVRSRAHLELKGSRSGLQAVALEFSEIWGRRWLASRQGRTGEQCRLPGNPMKFLTGHKAGLDPAPGLAGTVDFAGYEFEGWFFPLQTGASIVGRQRGGGHGFPGQLEEGLGQWMGGQPPATFATVMGEPQAKRPGPEGFKEGSEFGYIWCLSAQPQITRPQQTRTTFGWE